MKKVLVVEDDEIMQVVLKETLKSYKWEVDTALNGKIALEKILSEKYDLVLSDINMPEMNGIQLLEKVFHHDFDIPFIMLSGSNNYDIVSKAWKFGAFEFLEKPIQKQKLVNMCDCAIKHGQDYLKIVKERAKSIQ